MRIEVAVRTKMNLAAFPTVALVGEKVRLRECMKAMTGSLYPQFVQASIDLIDAELKLRKDECDECGREWGKGEKQCPVCEEMR